MDTALSTFSYLYDKTANRTQVTENVGGSASTVTFDYDKVYRLTLEKRITSNPAGSPMWYEYLYDDADNRTNFIQRDQMGMEIDNKGYVYHFANRLTLEGNLSVPGQSGNIEYRWDNNGNHSCLPSAPLPARLAGGQV